MKVTEAIDATQELHSALADRYGEGLYAEQLAVIFSDDAEERYGMLIDIRDRLGNAQEAGPSARIVRAVDYLLAAFEPSEGQS